MSDDKLIPKGRDVGLMVLAAALVLTAVPADAIDLTPASGKYRLNLDTTVSWGARYRVQDRDPAIISPFEGGTAWSVNGDDGNLNFDEGSLVSNSLKATVDIDFATQAGQHDFGFFVRGSAFYDFALENDCCERTELTQEALDWAGSRAELLDAYAWWQFPLGKGRGELRLGRQVLNWGESTFIPGGIGITNPVDVSALRVPGAELREAYRPVGLVWGSADISSQLSLEAYYQFEWEETVIDPPGTYFSTNDFAGRGGETVFIGFATTPDTGLSPWPWYTAPTDHPLLGVPRSPDREPDDGGQYGLALRWFVPSLGGTEFGFYFINYHSRLPTVNGISGTVEGAMAASAAGAAAALGVYGYFEVPPGVDPTVDAIADQTAQLAGTDAFSSTASYFIAYPEDIKLYGFSWNAQLGTSGIAFQGEASYRQDAPYLVDDVELLFAALSPISEGLALTNQVAPGGVGFSEEIYGYRLHDAFQFQFTLTKVWSRILGADQGVLVFEPAVTHVSGMPSKDELRYEGPGTYTSGNPIQELPGGAHAGKPYEKAEHFADPTSWGYRLAGGLTYNNAIGAWSLLPKFSWQHDVDGVSPGPGGNFIDGRTAFSVGIGTSYQNRWEIELIYTNYSGASRYNLINDRDFLGGFVKFSF